MTTAFGQLLDLLQHALWHPVSERNYHDIVSCIDVYASARASRADEQAVLAARGLPATYDPCELREQLRFGLVFQRADDVVIVDAVGDFKNNWSKS